jgi:hypothetical protein
VYDEQPGAGLDRKCLARALVSLWRWELFLPSAAKDAVSLGILLTAGGLQDAEAIDAAPPPLVAGGCEDLLQALHQTCGCVHA